jgi:hypothetical protein
VERVLFRRGARSITLRVSRPPHDEAGHLEIRIIEVEPPPKPPGSSRAAGPAPQTPGEGTA